MRGRGKAGGAPGDGGNRRLRRACQPVLLLLSRQGEDRQECFGQEQLQHVFKSHGWQDERQGALRGARRQPPAVQHPPPEPAGEAAGGGRAGEDAAGSGSGRPARAPGSAGGDGRDSHGCSHRGAKGCIQHRRQPQAASHPVAAEEPALSAGAASAPAAAGGAHGLAAAAARGTAAAQAARATDERFDAREAWGEAGGQGLCPSCFKPAPRRFRLLCCTEGARGLRCRCGGVAAALLVTLGTLPPSAADEALAANNSATQAEAVDGISSGDGARGVAGTSRLPVQRAWRAAAGPALPPHASARSLRLAAATCCTGSVAAMPG